MKSGCYLICRVLAILMLLCLLAGCGDKPVLERINTYKAPPFPSGLKLDRENYDYRIQLGIKNPPTLVDTLVCDLWKRMDTDLKLKDIYANRVRPKDVRMAIDFYVAKDFKLIVGYRSWTHSNFIRSLTKAERQTLANDVVQYIKKNGVREAQP